MVTYITREAIGLRPRSGGGQALVASEVAGIADHWPGMAKPIDARGDAGFRRVCSALRGWQDYHMRVRGWSDIAYQIAVDQEGRVYTLRGLNIRSGANGDGPTNRRYGAVLLVLGPGEKPSAKMKASCRAVHGDFKRRYSRCRTRPYGHGQVRPGGTTCPGPAAMAAISAGELDAQTAAPTTPPPTTATEGLMAGITLDQIKTTAKAAAKEAITEYMAGLYNIERNGTAAKNHAELEGLLRAVLARQGATDADVDEILAQVRALAESHAGEPAPAPKA